MDVAPGRIGAVKDLKNLKTLSLHDNKLTGNIDHVPVGAACITQHNITAASPQPKRHVCPNA
eukprot:gene6431-4148_t